MWHHEGYLRERGFREKSERYRQCVRRYGLTGNDHLSLYSWGEQRLPDGGRLVEMTEFHVTFYRGGEQLHFYYHETLDNHWQPGGHASANALHRLGLAVEPLRAEADAVAAALIRSFGGVLLSR